MGMSKVSFVHLIIIIQFYFVSLTNCQSSYIYSYFCIDTYGNYTNTSTYKANLDTLLSSVSSDTQTNSGFYNFSVGKDPDRVNGIALCRGDVTIQVCHKCLNDSANKLPQVCPNQKEAVGWSEYCMLRYSNSTMLGISHESYVARWINSNNVTDANKFNAVLGNLLSKLQSEAASGDSLLKFATGEAKVGNYEKVFALVQCTPDLSYQSCYNCIEHFIRMLPSCCANKMGARVLGQSCQIRYESALFYSLPSPPPPLSAPSIPPLSTNSTTYSGKGRNTTKFAILITIPAAILIGLAVGFCFCCRKQRKKFETSPFLHQDENDCKNLVSLHFGFDTIRVATENFSDANKLGRGGFGTVYKGILADGQEIAVKRLAKDSGQGDGEFMTEVLLVAKLQHRNLVKLIGFCLQEEERLLIYEFVPNTSLNHFLFDESKRSYLDWNSRYKIILGIARGILYLHEDSRLRIIHRDLKASNILLDAEMNPKVADFGMAKLFDVDQTQGDTNRIVGTYGYMAPEYAFHGFFSVKSDVYSFGVLVLEIITGRKNRDCHNGENAEDLISFVWRNWREDKALNIVDPTLLTWPRTEILRCIHMGLLCVQESVEDRPTMCSVVLMLSSHSLTLSVPSNPAFITPSANTGVGNNSDHTIGRALEHSSVNEDSITDINPR